MRILAAARSIRLVAGVAGSNPAEGMDVYLLCLCVVFSVQLEASATGWSLVQRSPALRLCVCLKNLNAEQDKAQVCVVVP
jgi:hypothetical protein